MTQPLKTSLGANIAALRKARGLTQEQLAAQLGVSAPAVSKWETCSSCPDITLLCPRPTAPAKPAAPTGRWPRPSACPT